ncbi:ribonuclease H-like domain-containing protein [Tanacetum coccineum]
MALSRLLGFGFNISLALLLGLLTASGLFLSQSKFAKEILEKAHMQHCNPCKTPVDNESKLGPDGDPVSDSTMYRSLPHLAALKRIIRYVCGTLDYGLQLHVSTTTQLTAYTDVDLAEAEYHRVANVVAETAWIRNLLLELHAPLHTATLVYCDNVSVVYLSTNLISHLPLANVLHMITIKLSSTNYLIWKNQMMPLLAYQKLTCYVDGFIPMPSSTIASGVIKK